MARHVPKDAAAPEMPTASPARAVEGRLESVNVGLPAKLRFGEKDIRTGIGKSPVLGPVAVRRLNLDGDGQADLRVHGGVDKAVYVYPQEHYARWQAELGRELPYGQFGENLTLSGLLEADVHVGDLLRVGEAILQVTQPRVPCYKLSARMGDPRFAVRFLRSGRSGYYCRVLQEGLVEAGQLVLLEPAQHRGPSVAELFADV